MALRERLVYAIDFTTDKATSGLQNLRTQIREAEGATGKLKAGWKGLTDQFKRSPATQAAVGAAAVAAAKVAIDAASDQEEAVNAVRKTYEVAAEDILKLGDSAVESAGMSKTAFYEFATQFSGFANDIADRSGRKVVDIVDEMATRTADFASVHNISIEEASQVMRSSLAGETEALRRYGGDVSAATVETYAYSNGIAEVGTKLTEGQKVLARYGVLMEETENVAGDFADTSESLANSQKRLNASMENLSAEVGKTLLPAVSEATDALADMASAMERAGDIPGMSQLRSFDGLIRNAFTGPLRFLGAFNDEAERGPKFFDELSDSIKRQAEAARLVAEEQQHAADVAERASQVAETQADLISEVNRTYREQQDELEEAARKQEEAQEAAEAYHDSLQAQRDEIDRLNRANMGLVGSDIAVRDAQRRANDAVDEFTRIAGDAESSADDIAQAQDDAAAALLNAAEAQVEMKAKTAEASGEQVTAADRADWMRAALGELAGELAPGSPLRQQLQGYIDQLNNIPRNVSTTVTVNGRTTSLPTSGGRTVGGIGTRGVGATGGIVTQPTNALIGEAGPEAVIPLSRMPGASPLPTGGLGAPIQLTVNAGIGTDGHQVGRQIVQALEAFYRNGGRPPRSA